MEQTIIIKPMMEMSDITLLHIKYYTYILIQFKCTTIRQASARSEI